MDVGEGREQERKLRLHGQIFAPRQLLLHCSTTGHPWPYAISALTSTDGGNAARLPGAIAATTSLWIM